MENIMYQETFAPEVNIKALVSELPLRQDTRKMYGRWLRVPRLTSWHGKGTYRFGGKIHEATPMTETLETLRVRLSDLIGVDFNSCLANYYRDGSDSVAWHSDDEPEMGPTIASLSFGDTRRFLVRPKGTHDTTEFWLRHGSLLVMSGDLQETHEHSIPKTRIARDPRLNLTFRVRS